MYVISQVIKTATVLYLVSLPMGMLLGLPKSLMIVGMGVFVTCYSLAGDALTGQSLTELKCGILHFNNLNKSAIAEWIIQGG